MCSRFNSLTSWMLKIAAWMLSGIGLERRSGGCERIPNSVPLLGSGLGAENAKVDVGTTPHYSAPDPSTSLGTRYLVHLCSLPAPDPSAPMTLRQAQDALRSGHVVPGRRRILRLSWQASSLIRSILETSSAQASSEQVWQSPKRREGEGFSRQPKAAS